VILSGSEDFLRLRELREAISVAEKSGRVVEYAHGADRGEISRVLSSTGVFFDQDVLLIVEEPDKIDVDLMLRHHEAGDSSVAVVLHQKGSVKVRSNLSRVAAALPDRLVARFERPKPWEEVDRAVKFCVREASRLNMKLSSQLATVVVRGVGSDLGVLAFEIEKLALLLRSGGESEATILHVGRTVGALGGLGPKPVVEALGRRDAAATGRALSGVRRAHAGHAGGAVLRVCAFVVPTATQWLHVASLTRDGLVLDQIAERVGVHPFVLRKNLFPAARRWGQVRLTSLLRSLAQVRRSVRSGHVSPWIELECALFRSLSEGSSG
jgi:DNA polymerase III delta subunit